MPEFVDVETFKTDTGTFHRMNVNAVACCTEKRLAEIDGRLAAILALLQDLAALTHDIASMPLTAGRPEIGESNGR